MRACFLGQNICALGYGVATLQVPPLVMDEPVKEPLEVPAADQHVRRKQDMQEPPLLLPFLGTHPL